ncbi:hypothetical protein Thpro_022557 [Acidihalobacter prosperus]|uniref:Uncharacterized protein n=1 Tax=Acidihalobacter prosperus TaxID=160660 RepID=A0A1A6C165_9GAMM|nr:hypothetical protein Thpro_022557 [Acidihalobacter prosperus]
MTSLLELLADRMQHAWRVDNAVARPDRILIDIDDPMGQSLWQTSAREGPRRIALSARTPPPDALHVLHKPIRARDLVSVLERSLEQDAARQGAPAAAGATGRPPALDASSLIQLRRWPSPQVVQAAGDRASLTRLSAVLIRRAMTLEQLAREARSELETARHFVELCHRQGWLAVLGSAPANQAPALSTRHERRGLFSRIRAGLGLGGQP